MFGGFIDKRDNFWRGVDEGVGFGAQLLQQTCGSGWQLE